MLATGPWFLHTYWDQRETDMRRTSRKGTWLSYKRNTRYSYGRREVKLQATHSFADRWYKCLEGSVWLHSLTGQHCAAVKWTSTGSPGFHVEEVCAGHSITIYWSQEINGRICCSIGLYPSKLDIVFTEERGEGRGGSHSTLIWENKCVWLCFVLFCFVIVVVFCIKHLTNLLNVGLHNKKGLWTKQITFPIGDSCSANKGNSGEGCGGVGHSRTLPSTRLFFPIQKVWASMVDHPNQWNGGPPVLLGGQSTAIEDLVSVKPSAWPSVF